MTVTAVTKQKKHLARVETDDGRTVELDQTAVREAGLRAGVSLSEEQLSELSAQSDYLRAKERALWYLDRGNYTERALSDKLRRAGFPPEANEKVLSFLREYGMVDDNRFARRFAEICAARNLSRRATFAKLTEKGVPRGMIEEVLSEEPPDEEAAIRVLLEKKYGKMLDTPESVQKVYAALMRRGFSYGAVKTVLKTYAEEMAYIEE